MAEQGYEVFYPERHDLKTQIERYKAATHVVAAEGSAIHLFAMVARADQKLAVIARRESGSLAQINRHVSSFSGLEPNSIIALKRTWMPEGTSKRRLGLGEIDLAEIQTQLQKAGFIETQSDEWVSLSESEVEEAIGDQFRLFETY